MRTISTTLRTRIAILLAIAALITQAILYIPVRPQLIGVLYFALTIVEMNA